MSKFAIPAISDEDLDISISAEIGAETRAKFSYKEIKLAGEIQLDDVDLGTLYNDVTFRSTRNGSGVAVGDDLVLVCASPVLSVAALVVTLGVTVLDSQAAKATGVLTATANVADGDTVSVGGKTYAFEDTLTNVANNVKVGASTTVSLANLAAAINAGAGAGTTYATATTANANVTATSSTSTLTATAITTGTAGNAIGSTEASTVLSWGGTTLSGGAAVSTSTTTAVATLTPPATARDQSFNFPPGLTVEFAVQSDVTKKVLSVDSLQSVTGGSPGAKLNVMALPASDTFTLVTCVTDKNFDPPTPANVAIACGYDAARWVKKGRSEVPKLELKSKFGGMGDGLPRVNGQRVTALLETIKNDTLLTERVFFGGWRPRVAFDKGDGNAESGCTATGEYENFLVFV